MPLAPSWPLVMMLRFNVSRVSLHHLPEDEGSGTTKSSKSRRGDYLAKGLASSSFSEKRHSRELREKVVVGNATVMMIMLMLGTC